MRWIDFRRQELVGLCHSWKARGLVYEIEPVPGERGGGVGMMFHREVESATVRYRSSSGTVSITSSRYPARMSRQTATPPPIPTAGIVGASATVGLGGKVSLVGFGHAGVCIVVDGEMPGVPEGTEIGRVVRAERWLPLPIRRDRLGR